MRLASTDLDRSRIAMSQVACDLSDALRLLGQLHDNGDARQGLMAVEVIALKGDLLNAARDFLLALRDS